MRATTNSEVAPYNGRRVNSLIPVADPGTQTRNRDRVWLNVASSVDVLDDYINLDNGVYYRFTAFLPVLRMLGARKYAASVESHRNAKKRGGVVLHDCRSPLPFRAGSVDHILCSHFLEHVYPDEATSIVRDFYRVLRPGGTAHLIVPNLHHLAQRYLEDDSPRAAADFIERTILSARTRPSWRFRLLEALGYEGLKHRWMYDEQSLTRLALSVGFHIAPLTASPSANYRSQDGAISVHAVGIKSTSP